MAMSSFLCWLRSAAALGGDAGRHVRVAHAAFGLVLVLAAGAAAAERVAPQVVGPDLDVDRAVDLRRHVHGGERRLPAGVGVERADAHQPMHAGLALQVAVGVVADDAQRGAADAGFLVVELIDDLGLEAVALGPAARTCA